MPIPPVRPGRFTLLLVVVALTFAPAAARGDDDGPPVSDGNFRQGLWTVEWTGSVMKDLGPQESFMSGGGFGVSYYFIENVALSAQVSGLFVDQPVEDAAAVEADLLLRHHLFHFDRYSFFLDVGAGLFEGDERVPASGTRFNFALQSGLGLTCRLRDNLYLIGGARYYHLSNADLEGDARNPSLNGVRGYFGLMFTF
jgi:hypothetical protein